MDINMDIKGYLRISSSTQDILVYILQYPLHPAIHSQISNCLSIYIMLFILLYIPLHPDIYPAGYSIWFSADLARRGVLLDQTLFCMSCSATG